MKEKPKSHLILTIDDDEDFNALIKKSLKKLGFETVTTTTPDEFLINIKTLSPDLCIVDLNIDRSYGLGFQIVQAIRNVLGPSLPIFIMSRRSSPEDISNAFELGATDYITKPLDEVVLFAKIRGLFLLDKDRSQVPATFFNLPRSKVPTNKRDCFLSLDMNIHAIDEYGLTVRSKTFLKKGTSLELKGQLIDDIFAKSEGLRLYVTRNWVDSESHECFAYLDFQDEDLMACARKYISYYSQSEDS